jgi:hypothetical protein
MSEKIVEQDHLASIADALREQGDLVGEVEGAAARRQELGEREDLLLVVVPADDAALRAPARDAHLYAVRLLEVANQAGVRLLVIEAGLLA